MIGISQVTRRFATAGGLILGLSLAGGALAEEVTTYRSTAPFDEVRQDLADAIINRGYVIDYEAYIGKMLARTAADVGASQTLFAEGRANSMQFCSAVLSRNTMEADVMNIAYCPYVLFVFQERLDDPVVTIGFRRLPERGSEESKATLAIVNKLLDDIAREAAGL
jgi:hypothetical protein